jgi:3-hydroxybutyryl-CoA dehydrogenase
MNFKNVTVSGSGVLGYQIAFQTAFHGLKYQFMTSMMKYLLKPKLNFMNYANAINKILMRLKNN